MATIVQLLHDLWLLVDAKKKRETAIVRHFAIVMATE
jgi:hypothetical protein